jgi:hypothetical protein
MIWKILQSPGEGFSMERNQNTGAISGEKPVIRSELTPAMVGSSDWHRLCVLSCR